MSDEFTPADIGAPVFVLSVYGGKQNWREAVIEKFHKTGKFVVSDSPRQYRSDGWSVANDGGSVRVVRATPERIELVKRANVTQAIDSHVYRLYHHGTKVFRRATTAQLVALHGILESVVGEAAKGGEE